MQVDLQLTYKKNTQSQASTKGKQFGNGDILVASFRTPTADKMGPGGNGGSISVVHYPGPNASRVVCLSEEAGDFTPNGKNTAWGDSPEVAFNKNPAYGVALKPETTYYFNVKNETNEGKPSCGSPDGNCPVLVTLSAR